MNRFGTSVDEELDLLVEVGLTLLELKSLAWLDWLHGQQLKINYRDKGGKLPNQHHPPRHG